MFSPCVKELRNIRLYNFRRWLPLPLPRFICISCSRPLKSYLIWRLLSAWVHVNAANMLNFAHRNFFTSFCDLKVILTLFPYRRLKASDSHPYMPHKLISYFVVFASVCCLFVVCHRAIICCHSSSPPPPRPRPPSLPASLSLINSADDAHKVNYHWQLIDINLERICKMIQKRCVCVGVCDWCKLWSHSNFQSAFPAVACNSQMLLPPPRCLANTANKHRVNRL